MIGYQLLNNNCYNPKHKFFGERAQVAYEPLPRKKKERVGVTGTFGQPSYRLQTYACPVA